MADSSPRNTSGQDLFCISVIAGASKRQQKDEEDHEAYDGDRTNLYL
jgi:hypothetical protein